MGVRWCDFCQAYHADERELLIFLTRTKPEGQRREKSIIEQRTRWNDQLWRHRENVRRCDLGLDYPVRDIDGDRRNPLRPDDTLVSPGLFGNGDGDSPGEREV